MVAAVVVDEVDVVAAEVVVEVVAEVGVGAGEIAMVADKIPDIAPLRMLKTRYNLAHVALWLGLMSSGFFAGIKATEFEMTNQRSTLHQRNRTPFIQLGENGRPSCRDNPMWCKGFSFVDEAQAWLSR